MVSTSSFLFRLLKSSVSAFLCGITSSSLAAGTAPGNQLNLYKLSLESLHNFSSVNTIAFQGRPSLWIGFQPACPSCESQLTDLACLPAKVRRVAIGIRGTRIELSKALRPASFKGEKLIASPELSRNFQIEATPTIMIVNSDGSLRKKVVGKTDCEKLRSYFEAQKPTEEI